MLAKDVVAARYADAISEKATSPDKIMYAGEDLVDLDPNLVVLSSGEHPRSFSNRSKWSITMILGAYCFLAPFTSTIFAPALQSVLSDLHEDDPTLGALQIAIFLLAFAIAPLFLAPLSETYGRAIVIRGGNVFFVIFCLGGGFAKTTAQLAVCRFLCGVGGSAALAVFGGVLSDVWGLADRAKANAILGTGLLLGPVMGPVCGGWMSQAASWRWACWVPAIAGAVLEIIATFFFRETHIPVLLKRKVAKLPQSYYTVLDFDEQKTSLLRASARPLTYLFFDPAMSVLAFYFAFVFGVQYLVIVTFQRVFGEGYGHSVGIVGTDLMAEGIGALLGMSLSTYLANWIYKHKKRHDPESRLLSAFSGAFFVTGGLFLYGFSATRTHFIVPLIGILMFCAGSTNSIISIQMYVIDGFDYPASAIAGLSVLRCLFAAVFPLFGNQLFTTLGIDWGIGLLAFLSLGIGGPILPLVYRYGSKLREMGKRNRDRLSM